MRIDKPYTNKQYADLSVYCNANRMIIKDMGTYLESVRKEKSQSEINAEKVAELKQLLTDTDYQAIKYSEGWLTDEEYAPIKAQREAYREEIRSLEN